MLGMFRPTLIAALLASGPLLLLAYLALGAVALPIGELLAVIKYALLGDLDSARDLFPRTSAILLHIRLPRALAGLLAGSSLAIAGAAMQGLFRNPLASPDILGISAGSSLGAVLAITTGTALLHPLVLPAYAIVGALISAALIYALALRSEAGQQLLFIILAGLALSSLLTGATSAALLLAEQYEISQFIFWTMGGLEGRMWPHVLWPAPFLILFGGLLIRLAKALDLISLGEENAHGMGLDVEQTRRRTLILCSVVTALAIAIAGPIGFIGLMVPHLVRLLFGPNHRLLLPLSAFIGAWLVLAADLIGRTLIAPHEIKVGIITAVLGGSYFIFLIVRLQRQGKLA
jgi:iron complex transport system permease protein